MAKARVQALLSPPAYPVVEAAHYLNLPTSTLRAWCFGQGGGKTRRFQPVIRLDSRDRRALSFLNLVEAHVFAALRRQHHVSLPTIRTAQSYVGRALRSVRPLADTEFETDGVDLFVSRLGALINVSQEGQIDMAEVIRAHLRRFERDAKGVPVRLLLFTRSGRSNDEPAPVVVDPRIAFGRPVLAGRGVPTAVLADRFEAGDTLAQLAQDYRASPQAIEEALRFELERKAA